MFKNKIYKRFERIYKYFHNNNEITHIFHTKLGDRKVGCIKTIAGMILKDTNTKEIEYKTDRGDGILIIYSDKLEENPASILFILAVDKKGKIAIINSKIDEPAIFSAIYELECLMYKEKQHEKGEVLKKLLSYYGNNYGSGIFPFRWWNDARS